MRQSVSRDNLTIMDLLPHQSTVLDLESFALSLIQEISWITESCSISVLYWAFTLLLFWIFFFSRRPFCCCCGCSCTELLFRLMKYGLFLIFYFYKTMQSNISEQKRKLNNIIEHGGHKSNLFTSQKCPGK